MSNSKIVVKNSMIGMAAQICSMIIGFITQRYFLRYLGLEVAGINSVVNETLGFLAFAELGVGTAISYRLYKPLVEKDTKGLTALMQVYRFLYQIIGVVVLLVGIILMIFLPIFINDASYDMSFIYAAYLIQLISTASSYFFAYKRTLIYVDQKQFVCKIVDILCNICYSVLRAIVLLVWHDYYVYLILQLLQTITANVILAYYCNTHYTFVKSKQKEKFEDVKGLFKDTKNVLLGRIAGYVYSSTDNLVISTFAGIVSAGGFSNYRYVTNAVKNLVHSMTDSITATIGNSLQVKNVEESYELLQKYSFIRYVVANIAATGLCICADAFVGFAFGTEYIMDSTILYLIVIDIFIGIVYGPLGEFVTVLGYFQYEKYINIIGAAINLGLSIALVQVLGVPGVLIGTCISQLFFWIAKSVLLCWKYFKSWKILKDMWIKYTGYILIVVIQVVVLVVGKNMLLPNQYHFGAFLIEGFASVALSVLVISVCYYRTEQYQYLLGIIKGIIQKAIRK